MTHWRPQFGTVGAPFWDQRPVIIVGAGPSLAGFDHGRLQGLGHVLAVKHAWKYLPFCDAVTGVDVPWMNWAHEHIEYLAKQKPVFLGVPDQPLNHSPIPGATYLRRVFKRGPLSTDPSTLECGGNSGHAALNLAFLKRAKTIYLFGFDYAGQHHNPQDYEPRANRDKADISLGRWAQHFKPVARQAEAAGVTILNASPASRVEAFAKVGLDEALQRLDRLRSKGDGRGDGHSPFHPETGDNPDPGAHVGAG